MDKVNIKIQVGNFKHPMEINPNDEPIFREAARLINERLVAYQTKYRAADLSHECMLSLAALDVASKYVRTRRENDTTPVEEAIKALTADLENFNQIR